MFQIVRDLTNPGVFNIIQDKDGNCLTKGHNEEMGRVQLRPVQLLQQR